MPQQQEDARALEGGRLQEGARALEGGRLQEGARALETNQNQKSSQSSEEPQDDRSRGEKIKDFAYDKTPDRFKNATDLQVRFRTGAIYVAVSVLCVLISEWTTLVLLAATAGICAGELYYMLRADAKLPNEMLGIIAAILYPVNVFFLGYKGVALVSFALLLALIVWYVFWMRSRLADVAVSFFGAAYCGMLLCGLMVIRMSLPFPWAGLLVLLIFVSVWANDSFAYLAGSKFGKHKLAPRVSPKKSWEGFFAGIVGSALFWCLMVLIPGVNMTVPEAFLFGVISALAGVLGDLAESRIKRNMGFKDSGTLLPGHGGLLDRCDSLFLVSITSAVLLIVSGAIPSVL